MHLDDGTIYWLEEVVYDGTFQATLDARTEPNVQAVAVRCIAYDPIWFGPPQREDYAILITDNELVFPIVFPIVFGVEEVLADVLTLENVGSWDSYPTITIRGPMSQARIENLSTNEKLELNYEIADDELVTITTTPGNKNVTNNFDAPLLGKLTTDSDIATFHLGCHPLVTNGLNMIRVFGVGTVGTPGFTFYWHNRYVGI